MARPRGSRALSVHKKVFCNTEKSSAESLQRVLQTQVPDPLQAASHLQCGMQPEHSRFERCREPADWLLARARQRPGVAIICGTGLGPIAAGLEIQESFQYTDIPNFPRSSVTGHDGQLTFGEPRGQPCVVMKGRFHTYEGYSPWKVTFPIRVLRLMGIETLLVTNAAGTLTDSYSPGDLMVIRDHINLPGLAGQSPLMGPSDEWFGPRFPALSDACDRRVCTLAREAAKHLGHTSIVREGVYVMVGGPSFESVAEARLLHALGADAAGMSTAAEVVVARHCGLRVFGLSLVTNMVSKDDSEESADHHSVLDVCQRGAFTLWTFLTELVGRLDRSNSSDLKDTETSYRNGA